MSLFGQTKRHVPSHKNPRRSPSPISVADAGKKYDLGAPSAPQVSRYFTPILVPIPRLPSQSNPSEHLLNGNGFSSTSKGYGKSSQRRYMRIYLPIPPRVYARLPRLDRSRRIALAGSSSFLVSMFVLFGSRKGRPGRTSWTQPFTDPDTLVSAPEEVAMIWEWEVSSGHYPSLQQPPEHIPSASTIHNPAVPESLLPSVSSPEPVVVYNSRRATNVPKALSIGAGPERTFINAWNAIDHHPGFPSRPSPGAILDLDSVMEKCDFGSGKYVRDCLEFLRIGAGSDNGKRVRRGNYLGQYKQTYYESPTAPRQLDWTPRKPLVRSPKSSRTPLSLPSPRSEVKLYDPSAPCDPDHPRLFHMFWAGPFTDKPYMAVMSFSFTQHLGLDKPLSESSHNVRATCRPQFWVWINPGPAAAVPNPNAKREMYESLATNPWSAPFLHERFRDTVKFKMWNTTEQLDGVDELAKHWRDMPIFNSGGNVYKQAQQAPSAVEEEPKIGDVLEDQGEEDLELINEAHAAHKKKDPSFEKVGSTSESEYDRLSVILSDMARFVLTYRFGGVYLDADTIFLRDWEESWNYRGQFAYRWSWHQKYNTAILKLHKGSALGRFLFKTALENGLDFHPMTVSRYLKDAGSEKLSFRIPDALFDPAWSNMERYQRERPPFPYFPEFSVFFSNDKFETAAPQPLGFDGFFRGAFSYHFHNFWWSPFDPSRNWPDLGQRFIKGERVLRDAIRANKGLEAAKANASRAENDKRNVGVTDREDMDDEIDSSWSTVLKRTFEAYVRGERPNMYGEWSEWEQR